MTYCKLKQSNGSGELQHILSDFVSNKKQRVVFSGTKVHAGVPQGSIIKWSIQVSILKGNADKYHLIASSKTPVGIEVSNITIMSEEKVKLLGIHRDNRLNVDYHISQLCKKAGKIACSNSSFQIPEHFTTQINCKCFYNVSILIFSFNLNIS